MFMRSWEHKYAESDIAQGLRRRFFGPDRYSTEVYYDTYTDNDTLTAEKESLDSRRSIPPTSPPTSAPTHSPQQSSPRSSLTVSHPQEPAFSRTVETVEDVPIAVLDVVNTIVATKIKKDGIDSTRSIAQLSGGRSTLTNEIIGDLHLEFGSHVPERAEQLPFAELVAALRRSLGGDVKLGKKTSAIVNGFISSKFPGAFGLTKARDYLSRWGLGEMRQDAVLLRAVRHQPESRLSSVHEARRFLDGVVRNYFEQQGLSLPTSGAEATGAAGSDDQALDAKSLQLLNERNQNLLHDICSVISRHLPSEMAVKRDELSALDEWQADLEELELFRNEHGDDYINGIKPIFDIRKERVYDSFWNWCTRDVAILFDLAKHPTINNIDLIESISRSIINRATDKSIARIQHLCSQTSGEKTHHGRIMRLCLQASISFKNGDPAFIDSSPDLGPITSIDKQGKIIYTGKPRTAPFKLRRPSIPQVPYAVGSYDHGILTLSDRLGSIYAEDLDNARQSGMSFRSKSFLVTGAGRNSIGFEVLKCLVEGGARCTVTTSSYGPEVTRMYQQLYSRHGGKDSVLRVLPFNQGSRKDIQELAKIMVDGWEPDFIIPFAAISENGRELEDLDSKSELAHRLMLTNLLRLLGTISRNKRQRGITTRPATVVLPLSPNHGLLGNDGLYAESKRGLETLLSKWKSETWRDYLSMLAVVIGWTRSTGLMEDNNIVAQGVEALGVRTFSKEQMAGLIACLPGGRMNPACQSIPLVVDLSGGMGKVNDLKEKLTRIRHELKAEADGAYSLEGCVEMAWMMGLIKHDPHAQKNGSPWTGWVDAKTSEDGEVPSKYMSFILQNTGLREIDPGTCDNNYDPERKTTVQEIELTQDLPPFEASLEVAQSFQLQHGSKAEINKAESGVYLVWLRAVAKILLPKATRFNRSTVAGQIPTGWSAKRYGIADEIIDQVDPVTLFTLVSTVGALLASGIVDPYELYQYIHLSEVGKALGSSMGGLSSLRKVHRDRFLEKPVQGDILQETFTSTIGAWCNMLPMSSTGPIKTPVGACATSLESLDTGYDLLVSQKGKGLHRRRCRGLCRGRIL
ncbi:Fatty acid synthase apf5 [Colletotrichum trifolii]|uniref:Fatty acid synthase apf5 n=1 Tax=Colletotrichum trifolii TaxID=5466 RepID=A0A4R8RZ48_COLTR|nr:Fatty acid synthase apf5 [Colletotrichum trifolii]